MKALVFDLDGTLVDSVYQHLTAWAEAFRAAGSNVPLYEIHRRIGMNGNHMIDALNSALHLQITAAQKAALIEAHADNYENIRGLVRVFDGADELSRTLKDLKIGMAIATSAKRDLAQAFLNMLKLDDSVVVVTADDIDRSKPSDAQFQTAFAKLGVNPQEAAAVGDSTWDMLAACQAGSLGVGVLTDGYSREELSSSGAVRVFCDVRELLDRLPELGVIQK